MATVTFTQRQIAPDWEHGAVVVWASAGEALEVGDAVYLNGAQDNVGEAFLADADALGGVAYKARGIVVAVAKSDGVAPANSLTAVDGDRISICVQGAVYGFTGLTPGSIIYASNTAGDMVDAAPGNDWQIGWALDATTIYVQPDSKSGSFD